MTAAAVTLAVLVGLLIGSFLTVVTSRVPEGLSIVSPRSRCPVCETPIATIDNVPILSYAIRRGRCRGCSTHISLRYPATEFATAAAFGLVTARVPALAFAPAYCALAAGLIALTVIDLERFRLPTPIIVATAAIGLPLLAIAAATHHDASSLVRVPVASAAAFAAFGLIFVIVPKGMGFGDVRLAALCGAFLGEIGYRITVVGFLASFVIAGVVAIGLVVAGRAKRRTRVPFGPFLAAGTFVAVCYGAPIARAWLG